MTGGSRRRAEISALLRDAASIRQSKSYMLKLWNDADEGASDAAGWRASLTDVRTAEARHFGSLEALLEHLGALLREHDPEAPPNDGG